jgi:hypothetical protein
MGLGVLEDGHLQHVPGTALLADMIGSQQHEYHGISRSPTNSLSSRYLILTQDEIHPPSSTALAATQISSSSLNPASPRGTPSTGHNGGKTLPFSSYRSTQQWSAPGVL